MLFSLSAHLKLLDVLIDYRYRMPVTEYVQRPDGEYYICPRCKRVLARDYQAFCDRCGQHLDWRLGRGRKEGLTGKREAE